MVLDAFGGGFHSARSSTEGKRSIKREIERERKSDSESNRGTRWWIPKEPRFPKIETMHFMHPHSPLCFFLVLFWTLDLQFFAQRKNEMCRASYSRKRGSCVPCCQCLPQPLILIFLVLFWTLPPIFCAAEKRDVQGQLFARTRLLCAMLPVLTTAPNPNRERSSSFGSHAHSGGFVWKGHSSG